MTAIATAAMHRRQDTELVRLMEEASAEVLTNYVPRGTRRSLKLHRSTRPGIPGFPLPHHSRGTLVRRRVARA